MKTKNLILIIIAIIIILFTIIFILISIGSKNQGDKCAKQSFNCFKNCLEQYQSLEAIGQCVGQCEDVAYESCYSTEMIGLAPIQPELSQKYKDVYNCMRICQLEEQSNIIPCTKNCLKDI